MKQYSAHGGLQGSDTTALELRNQTYQKEDEPNQSCDTARPTIEQRQARFAINEEVENRGEFVRSGAPSPEEKQAEEMEIRDRESVD